MSDMLNCAEFQNQLQTWLDGSADEAASAALESHLNECAPCQALLEPARQEDQQLRVALAEPQAAARVAQRAIDRMPLQSTGQVAAAPRTNWSMWLLPLISIATGFLLAMVILPLMTTDEMKPPIAKVPDVVPAPVKPPVAHLVASTGRVERFDDARQEWVSIDQVKMFACPTDSRVRTMPDVRCELQTANGCVIRMNDRTEVTLRGSSSVELTQGQVWCRSPREASLEVRVASAPKSGEAKQPTSSQPTLWCVGNSCLMTGIEEAGRVQVVNASGEINLRTAAGEERLEPGQMAEISNGQVSKPGKHFDPILATGWMQPLLVTRGGDNAELQERVDILLAEIGRSKAATLYEHEIRSLGEHAVLPLVRFIQSPLAANDEMRRLYAMRITSDLAPVWLIPDLIDLLADRDGRVRQMSAATLHRLTALDMSQPPASWREEPNEQQATALADWRTWWAAHRDQFPKHQLRITRE